MMYPYKLILYCFCLTILSTMTIAAEGTFEDAELVNEFITMSFSSSHPYDLRHTIPGEPDIDYPIYSAVPKTNFDCNGRHEGYYADIETRCQVFRICTNTDLVGRGFAFLCPNGTLFSQKNFVCDWYRNVDCSESERFYSKNDGNRIGSTSEMMETVRQMMEHPMKTITIALNRGKPISQQPLLGQNTGISTTRDPRIFRTTPVPLRNVPTQQVSTRTQPVTLQQVGNASGFLSQSSKQNPFNQGRDIFDSSLGGGARNRVTPTGSRTTPLPPLLGVPTLPRPSLSMTSRASLPGGPSLITESTVDRKEVYVSNLGELSTDPGANFDHQTARIIAEPTSSSISVQVTSELVPVSSTKMNFAQKVNAGLNGLQVVNRNEIIAPEYVKNILHNNVPIPDREIQPPSFEFASNINSLLDEVAYESELEGQNSMHVQLRTPSDGILMPTKRPFRFLSRGFSYDGSRQEGSYIYGPPTAPRGTLPRLQTSTSTQSYTYSFSTTPLFTTSAPVTPTEAGHISESEQRKIEFKPFFDSKVDITSRSSGRAANELVSKEATVKVQSPQKNSSDDTTTKRSSVKFSFSFDTELKSKQELGTKSTIKIDEKVENSINDLPQEPDEGSKVSANKRAEKLLVAGFKQTILNNLSEKNATDDDLVPTTPIVPIYIRVSEVPIQTIPVTSLPSTTLSTSRTYLPTVSSTTSAPLNQTTQPIRRFTVNEARRRRTTRPNAFVKRQNVVRSVRRTTTSTTTQSTTVKLASNVKITSTTTPTSASSARKRPTVSRFSFGSRKSATNETTTAPRKKIAVRSSDKDVSDLTAVASTYNEAPKRDFNSIRQNSYKYAQQQRRHPAQKTNRTETTTIRSTSSITPITQEPRRSSSLPTPTLAPFSHDDLFSLSTTSTTLAPSPATFLSFTDLTKAIIDDSILQTFRRNQDIGLGSTMSPPTLRRQPDAPIRQQAPAFTTTTPRSHERPTAPTIQQASQVPSVSLKDFIASKFGAHYSPSPPKVSTPRTIQTTPVPSNELPKSQKQTTPTPQYPAQQYISHQDRTVAAIKPAPAVQFQQNIHQQPQFVVQQQQVPQQQYFHLHQQQVLPASQYAQYPQLAPTVQSVIYRPIQAVQLVQPINYRFQTQQQSTPTRVPFHQQQQQQLQHQRTNIQQSQQIHLRTVHEQQQVAQLQRHQQLQHGQSTPKHQPQIQIFPSQVAVAQTIPSQHPNAAPSTNIIPPLGSINVRLPTSVGGLIPNTNLFDSRLNNESLGRAQKRIDQLDGEATAVDAERERKSVYSGVTSYEVPLNSVGRLANDITHLLRRLRRL